MATSQEAAVLIVQQLKAGYADSYSAVGHVVDRSSVTLTGQPSATTRQLAALNVQASAEAAARNQSAVTVGALSLLATGAASEPSTGGGVTSGGALSGGVVPVVNGGFGSSVGGVGALVAGGAVLAAALPTAGSLLGRALLSGSSSVAGAVPFRSTALPGIGTQNTPTVYRINTGAPAPNTPVGTPYGTPSVSLVNGVPAPGNGQSPADPVPAGTLLPDGTLAGVGGVSGGAGAGVAPDLAGLGSLGVTSDPAGAAPGVELAGLSAMDDAVKTPDLAGLGGGGGGIPGGAGGLGGIGGGLGGLGAGAVRSVAFGDVAAMTSASSAMSAPMAGMSSAGASSMGGMMPMMPMGGGAAAGDQGGNRRVPAWLVETEDVWGESAAVAPGVIGDSR